MKNAQEKEITFSFTNKSLFDENYNFPYNETPLIIASKYGDFSLAKHLISMGANVNAVNTNNQSALIIALIFKKYDIAKLLIENQADVNFDGYKNFLHHFGLLMM